jgi:hypothetical protein
MKVGRRLVYPDSVRGLAIKLDSVVTEVKVAGSSQLSETKEHDIQPLGGSGEFVGPTAAELIRFIYTMHVMPSSEEMNQGFGSFASLLNRGSCLE